MKKAPSTLDEPARQKWAKVYKVLDRRGDDLNQGVLDCITAYAAAWARWSAAEAEIATVGPIVRSQTGAAIANPWCAVSATALRQVVRLACELKLTPKAKGKAAKAPKPEAPAAGGGDPLEQELRLLLLTKGLRQAGA